MQYSNASRSGRRPHAFDLGSGACAAQTSPRLEKFEPSSGLCTLAGNFKVPLEAEKILYLHGKDPLVNVVEDFTLDGVVSTQGGISS